ncbi:methyltransferase [Roseibium suaedae]|uniref:Methyltransferase small domain-containing protein n=1 Tax=Roseibium suaedae TaxID=735517 RepID=A0A1M7PJ39_9HYPH|nr:methyltransferase [Roseibium suaedae]SHN17078.1 Methyltransferase small domain-containing protein [Roseibium suaedae]
MAKLTKAQRKAHTEAEAILRKDRLSEDEKDFVFQNWHEGANHINGAAGAFFTPWGLAADFSIDAGGAGGRVIDLCAGIGILSYFLHHRAKWADNCPELTCVEVNPRYVEVGRKLLPEARWICADVFDWRDWQRELGGQHFDVAVSNPPFGAVRRTGNGPRYRGRQFEFHVIDIAAQLADRGAFIVPQTSAAFRYSGAQYFKRVEAGPAAEFERLTGYRMHEGAGVDTSMYKDDWKDTSIICEIACYEFDQDRARHGRVQERLNALPVPVLPYRPAEQLVLL